MLNLPIKIIAQDNKFDANYHTIIMLSGQGSSGKTTFWQTYLPNEQIIAMDNIVNNLKCPCDWSIYLNIFFAQIKQYTCTNCLKNIVLDYSHDTIEARAMSLEQISNPSNFNFIIIHLSLDVNTLIENDKRRKQVSFLSESKITKMLRRHFFLYKIFTF